MPRLTLAQRAILVMASIIVAQAFFAFCFANMQSEAIRKADQGVETQALITRLNLVSLLWCSAAANSYQCVAQNKGNELAPLKRYQSLIGDEFRQIQPLIRDTTERKSVSELKKATEDTLVLLTGLQQCWPYNDRKFFENVKEVQLMIEETNRISQSFVSHLLSVETTDHKQQTLNESRLQLALVLGLGLNFALIIGIGTLFADKVVGKLSLIAENSKRLAAGRALQPASPGSDEISLLEQDFHEMANEIVAARIRERAAVDNSLDLIFSLSPRGIFRNINPTVQEILGYKPGELLEKSYLEIVKPEEKDRVAKLLKTAIGGAAIPPIEHKAIKKGNSEVDLQLTAHWSKTDDSLFCVVHDVTQQHRLQRQREEFTGNITQALREPLVFLSQTLNRLHDTDINEEQELKEVHSARQAAQPVLNLVSNLLQLEKIQAGMVKLSLSSESILALIEDAIISVADTADLKSIVINAQLSDAMVEVDGQTIHELLVTLLKNAIFNSPNAGQIDINCICDNTVTIEITDAGPKWSMDDFDPFAQARRALDSTDHALRRKYQGTHLELAICKTIVEVQKGSIKASTGDPEAKRSSITVTLPLAMPNSGAATKQQQ